MMLRRVLPAELLVDISEVTFVDSAGEETLMWLSGIGAGFIADSSYSAHLCERLGLPFADEMLGQYGEKCGD